MEKDANLPECAVVVPLVRSNWSLLSFTLVGEFEGEEDILSLSVC